MCDTFMSTVRSIYYIILLSADVISAFLNWLTIPIKRFISILTFDTSSLKLLIDKRCSSTVVCIVYIASAM